MTIDLKWALPFVMPFVLFGYAMLVCWAFGVSATGALRQFFATNSFAFGGVGSAVWVYFMHQDGIRWTVRIGGKRND